MACDKSVMHDEGQTVLALVRWLFHMADHQLTAWIVTCVGDSGRLCCITPRLRE